MSSLACCAGTLDLGTPTGKVELLGGTECYVAQQVGSEPPEFAIILITDVFGFKLNNIRLMADKFALKSPKIICVVPDIFHGTEVPDFLFAKLEHLMSPTSSFFNKVDAFGSLLYHFPGFIMRNSFAKGEAIIINVINALRSELNVKKVATSGFCWGGTISIKLGTKPNLVDACVAAHPGYEPKDYEMLVTPTCFILPTLDHAITPPKIELLKKLMDSKAPTLPSLVKAYENMKHGFAVRGDSSNPEVCAAREDAFETTFSFIQQHIM